MSKLFAWAFRRRQPNLRDYERAILEAVEAALPSDTGSRLRSQREEVNLVQRHSQDKEVNLYRMRGGKVAPPVEFRFSNDAEELLLARVRLESLENAAEVIADVWLVRGVLFSITFDRPPKSVSMESHRVKSCELFTDPNSKYVVERDAASPAGDRHSSRLAVLKALGEVKDVRAPVDATDLELFLRRYPQCVPEDYVSLLGEADGFVFAGWRCLGTQIRRVVTEDRNITVLAEHPTQGLLCSVDAEALKKVYFYDFEDDEFALVGHDFMQALFAVSRGESKRRARHGVRS